MQFKRASRRQVKFKLALTGPSGAGKTYSALLIASGLGKKIALLDTENHSASLYGDAFEFDELTMNPPYLIQKYRAAIDLAVKEKYDVLVIDSITHAWAGDGGLLAKKEALDAAGKGNGYTNWAGITKEHEAFKAALLNADIHLICTMRSKQDYALVDEKGKQVPKKIGLAPIQREGMEYEFTTVLDLSMNHHAEASKDRTGLFDGQMFIPDKNTGVKILDWLSSAAPPEPPQKPDPSPSVRPQDRPATTPLAQTSPPAPKASGSLLSRPGLTEKEGAISEARVRRLWAIASASGWTNADVHAYLQERLKIESTSEIHWKEYDAVVQTIQENAFDEAMHALGVNVAPRQPVQETSPPAEEPPPWEAEAGGPPPGYEREPGEEG